MFATHDTVKQCCTLRDQASNVQTVTAAQPAKPPHMNDSTKLRGARTVLLGRGTGIGAGFVVDGIVPLEEDILLEELKVRSMPETAFR